MCKIIKYLINMFKLAVNSILGLLGWQIRKVPKGGFYYDMEKLFFPIYHKCKAFSMTSVERMYSLYKAIEYIHQYQIPGDIVECGNWRGGSVMLSAMTLQKLNDTNKKIYLYDTFEGMSAPTSADITHYNETAKENLRKIKRYLTVSLEGVKANVYSTAYPKENFIFIKGKVEETIPGILPAQIALLRLDTDWYESTYHELKYLFPLISKGGILLVDDYGFWQGARKAVDQYIRENNIQILLTRIDPTGRIAVKLTP